MPSKCVIHTSMHILDYYTLLRLIILKFISALKLKIKGFKPPKNFLQS